MSVSIVSILNKLFWGNSFRKQLAGAIVGAYLGLLLLLSAIQFYCDVQSILHGGNTSKEHFIQLNKKVNIFNTLGGASSITKQETEEINILSTVEAIGVFQSNSFKAGAYSDLLGFYTELFFESVPDEFLDVDEPGFRWSEGGKEIPVIVARDYLALYNFGFAPSQGLPQISAKSAGRMVMDVRLEGNGRKQTLKGRIVGFSDRINSILVPESFMNWANNEFGTGTKEPSKIILKVLNPMDKNLMSFIEENGYEVSTGRLVGEEFVVVFKLIVSGVVLLASVILLLAATVFLLGFQLVISNNAPSIKMLLEQGYAPQTIAKFIETKFLKIFIGVALAVFVCLFLLHYLFVVKMKAQGFILELNLHWMVYLFAFFSISVLIWQNISRINSAINRLA